MCDSTNREQRISFDCLHLMRHVFPYRLYVWIQKNQRIYSDENPIQEKAYITIDF